MSEPGTGAAPLPPPPGWQPPPPPPPSYTGGSAPPAPPGPPAPPDAPYRQPVPGMLGAAHKPGAMPLRPLNLGDMYDAAFRIIRFNPKATVGSAVLVSAVAWVIPIVVTAVLSFTVGASLDVTDGDSDADLVGVVGSLGSLGLGTVLSTFGTILVTGMISHVAGAAAIGRRLTLGEAWAATRGKRWRLIGLAFLLGFSLLVIVGAYALLWVAVVLGAGDNTALIVGWGLVSVPAFLCVLVWFWVRVYYLPVPALMLEPVGVFGAIGRGFALTRRQFWRTFGIALLTVLVVAIASNVVGVPLGIVAQVVIALAGIKYTLIILTVTQALSQVISAAFVTPFTSSVTSLQYLDQRMRKEAYDVELMQQAGVTAT